MADNPKLMPAEDADAATDAAAVQTEAVMTTEAEVSDDTAAAEYTDAEHAVAMTDNEDADAPAVTAAVVADSGEAAGRRRFSGQTIGTLLIIIGLVTIGLTVGFTVWRQYQHTAETKAFLARVSTPGGGAISLATTPFPSTVSGALVPDTARTPTANAATRAAQPVATTSDGRDRSIIAPVATPAITSTPKPRMAQPTHIDVPAIKVNADIVEVGVSPIEVNGQPAYVWDVAPYAVGHHFSSANPGEGENVVLSGHDDWEGEVFKNLYKLQKGDEIDLRAGDRAITYHVEEILLVPEVGQTLDKRIENAKLIGTTGDERLTLVTCWPYGVDDHRLIVIARPG